MLRKHSILELINLDEDCLNLILVYLSFSELLYVRLTQYLRSCVKSILKNMKICDHFFKSDDFLLWTMRQCPSLELLPRNTIINNLWAESRLSEYLQHPLCEKFNAMDLSAIPSHICKSKDLSWTFWWMKDIVLNGNTWCDEKVNVLENRERQNLAQCRVLLTGGKLVKVLCHFSDIHTVVFCQGHINAPLLKNVSFGKYQNVFVCRHMKFFDKINFLHFLLSNARNVEFDFNFLYGCSVNDVYKNENHTAKKIYMPDMSKDWKDYFTQNGIHVARSSQNRHIDLDYFQKFC